MPEVDPKRVRILVVSNIYPPVVRGGYEVECAGVVGFLRERGDDVRVLTSRYGSGPQPEPGVARELPFLPYTKSTHASAPLRALSGARIARAHLDGFRPELAFVWNASQIPYSALHAILSSGTPTAFRVCEHWFGGLFSRDFFMRYLAPGHRGIRGVWGRSARAINMLPSLRLTASVAAPVAISWVSEYLRGAVSMPVGFRPVLERTIHATTQNDALFSAAQRRPAPKPVVAFAGRLSSEKGADVAIAAVGLLADQGFDVELVLAGDGSPDDRQRLDQEIDRADVRRRCTFAGRLDPAALRDLLARASVLAVPSVWQEPFPLVAIEGAFARVPLVVSRVGGIPELVTDEEAILVPPGDPVVLAEGIAAVLSRPAEATARVARAFARAQSLSWGAYLEATGAFVDDSYAALTTVGNSAPADRQASRSPKS